MSILTDASLIITPNAVKSGSLLAVVPSNGNGDLTWTRNGGATKVNSAGLIENVLANVPRLDYSLGSCPNILLEPQRTNLLKQSNNFSSILDWPTNTNRPVLTANYATSPDGIMNATRFEYNAMSFQAIYQDIAVTAGLTYATSIWVKNNGGIGALRLWLDTSGSVTTPLLINPTSEWVRYTVISTASDSSARVQIAPNPFSQTIDCLIYGAQVEVGAYPTSYIPTTSATVTRVADVASKTGISSLINSEEGVFFLEASTFIEGGSIRLISLTDGTSANRISFTFHSTNNRIQAFGQKNNAPLFNLDTTTAIQTSFNKIAIKFITGNVKFFMNGLLIGSATTTDFFAGNTLNSLVFEAGNNSLFFEGKLKSLQLYKTPLTDTQCIQLTTL